MEANKIDLKRKCFSCWNYNAFYIKQDTCFKRLTEGMCTVCNQVKDHYETCEKWRSRPHFRFGMKRNTERILRETLFQLAALKHILQEQNDAEKR